MALVYQTGEGGGVKDVVVHCMYTLRGNTARIDEVLPERAVTTK